MAKRLTEEEIAELGEIGSLKYDPETHNIGRFGELIDKLGELISMNASRVQADLARSQSQLEVLGTLQKMIRQQSATPKVSAQPVDLGPLQEVLAQIHMANAEKSKQAFKFDINRDPHSSLMASVIATPIAPTEH